MGLDTLHSVPDLRGFLQHSTVAHTGRQRHIGDIPLHTVRSRRKVKVPLPFLTVHILRMLRSCCDQGTSTLLTVDMTRKSVERMEGITKLRYISSTINSANCFLGRLASSIVKCDPTNILPVSFLQTQVHFYSPGLAHGRIFVGAKLA